jgi:hypothetical protein
LMYGIIPINMSRAPTPPKILLVSIDIFNPQNIVTAH